MSPHFFPSCPRHTSHCIHRGLTQVHTTRELCRLPGHTGALHVALQVSLELFRWHQGTAGEARRRRLRHRLGLGRRLGRRRLRPPAADLPQRAGRGRPGGRGSRQKARRGGLELRRSESLRCLRVQEPRSLKVLSEERSTSRTGLRDLDAMASLDADARLHRLLAPVFCSI